MDAVLTISAYLFTRITDREQLRPVLREALAPDLTPRAIGAS